MAIRKTLTLLALPLLLIGGEAAAGPCSYTGCGTQMEDAQAASFPLTLAPPLATAIQMSGAAAKSDTMGCSDIWCGMNGPELTGMRAPSSAASAAARQPQPRPQPTACIYNPFCKLATNGPELTGLQPAPSAAIVTAIRLPVERGRRPARSPCAPWACGKDGNGPELTGIALPRRPKLDPPPQPRPIPVPLPYPTGKWR